jgi:hypothetical protein
MRGERSHSHGNPRKQIYLAYEEQKARLTRKPADFQLVFPSIRRLAIRRFFFLIGLFPSRSDAMSGYLEMLRMAAE